PSWRKHVRRRKSANRASTSSALRLTYPSHGSPGSRALLSAASQYSSHIPSGMRNWAWPPRSASPHALAAATASSTAERGQAYSLPRTVALFSTEGGSSCSPIRFAPPCLSLAILREPWAFREGQTGGTPELGLSSYTPWHTTCD